MNTESTSVEVLERYWDGKLPVKIVALAKACGAGVYSVDPDINDNFSGQLVFSESCNPKIIINSRESKVRQRFIVAHELGHLLLQHGESFRDTFDANYQFQARSKKEVQANRFASELLMPAQAVDWLIFSREISDISILADKFLVSKSFIKYRLLNLGIL